MPIALTVLFIRGCRRLLHAELWAEDGMSYLLGALKAGWPALFLPTGATPQFLQNGISLLGFHLFPLRYYPLYMACMALLVKAFVFGYFSKKTFRWLVANDWLRHGIVVALCCAPGLTEMWGNIANINWFLFFFCALLLLKDPKENFSNLEIVAFGICLYSIGTGLLLLPLWVWRISVSRKKRAWILGGLLLLHLVILQLLKTEKFFGIPPEPFSVWLKTYWRVLLESFFLQPWVGDRGTIFLFHPANRILHSVVCAFLVFLFLFLLLSQRKGIRTFPLFTFFLSLSFWPVLCWVGRPGSLDTFLTGTPSEWYFAHRYSFPIAFAAVLIWSTLMSSKKSLTLIFCILFILHTYGRFQIPRYGMEEFWKESAPLLEKARQDREHLPVEVKVYPKPLSFVYSP